MIYYLNMFVIGSILGFIMELLLKMFIFTSMNSSILYGPWLPVYGFGIVFSILIERLVFNRVKTSKLLKIIIMFLLIMVTATVTEYLGGMFIEKAFHKTFWNYSNLKFNMGKYVALEISLIWGILSLVFLYFLKPKLDKVVKKIPSIVTYLVLVIMLIDLICTIILKV